MPKKKKKDYKHSAVKYYLEKDLIDGTIPLKAKKNDHIDLYKTRPEFSMHDGERLFKSRLTGARSRARKGKSLSETEDAALVHDRTIYPKLTIDRHGRPVWEGSAVQKRLIADVKAGVHLPLKPNDRIFPEHNQREQLC